MSHDRKFSIATAVGAVVVVFFTGCGGESSPPGEEHIGPLNGEFLTPKLPPPSTRPLRLEIDHLRLNLPLYLQKPRFSMFVGEGGEMRVELRENMLKNLVDGYQIELWVRLADNVDQVILSADGLELGLRDWALYCDVGEQTLHGYPIMPDEWQHLAVVVKGSEAVFYLNGWFQERIYLPAGAPPLSGSLVVGGPVSRTSFTGIVDDLRLTAAPGHTPNLAVDGGELCNRDTVFAFDFDGAAYSVYGESHKQAVPAACGTDVIAHLTAPALLRPQDR